MNAEVKLPRDKRKFLKIKLKSLAAEARIIRREEQRTKGDLREQMYLHRIQVVRPEARATHLAYGFLRGRTWSQIEKVPEKLPFGHAGMVKKVIGMVVKYGDPSAPTPDVESWFKV